MRPCSSSRGPSRIRCPRCAPPPAAYGYPATAAQPPPGRGRVSGPPAPASAASPAFPRARIRPRPRRACTRTAKYPRASSRRRRTSRALRREARVVADRDEVLVRRRGRAEPLLALDGDAELRERALAIPGQHLHARELIVQHRRVLLGQGLLQQPARRLVVARADGRQRRGQEAPTR